MKHFKKFLCLFLSLLLLMSVTTTLSANSDIKVTVDGKQVIFDVAPCIIDGRTLVPVRAIFEALGATVTWYSGTQTIVSSKGTTVITMVINNNNMTVANGDTSTTVTLDVPPCILDGRTLVPVRAISEAYNTNVDWIAANRTVVITSKAETCYPGTTVPTYTSVTGVALKSQLALENGTPIYIYNVTTNDHVTNYWQALADQGWMVVSEDDATTEDTFEAGFANLDLQVVMVFNVYFDVNEIWISVDGIE